MYGPGRIRGQGHSALGRIQYSVVVITENNAVILVGIMQLGHMAQTGYRRE